MRRGESLPHAHGPRQRDICWVNGGSLPTRFCERCNQDPSDQLEVLIKRLENARRTPR